ncbi:MAG: hypothetical protein UX25_C0015G0013 [Candidatus Woesebacteria bacterium GW2011_GWC2_45_9]|uniref:DUF4258 domain-containing protein n=1 Tax=Candidatus Woesebacteria bacterium GW2011_GWC2_45_9 TaxID=1618589 RepID=A0A0G1N9H5_9BACT|nr:MAG: hypothetical protein UX25_C0015G0013 [Candidatus Woesebacteria bacterium GW2011_GWC2_45_9]
MKNVTIKTMVKEIIYSKHALEMLSFRKIGKRDIKSCLRASDKVSLGRKGRKIYYKGIGKKVLKVVVAENKSIVVVTCHWIASDRIKL